MTTNYRATVETAGSSIEANAVGARVLFEGLYPAESWDELIGLADRQQTPALARQGAFMRAARFALDTYARRAVGIMHRNPMSIGERQRTAAIWARVVTEPVPRALAEAAKVAAIHVERVDAATSRTIATGGRGAVAAMIRDFSRTMVRLSAAAG